jgi:hypothetical protein
VTDKVHRELRANFRNGLPLVLVIAVKHSGGNFRIRSFGRIVITLRKSKPPWRFRTTI